MTEDTKKPNAAENPPIRLSLNAPELTMKEIRERLDENWEVLKQDLEGRTLREIVLKFKNQNTELWQILNYLYYELKQSRSNEYGLNKSMTNLNQRLKHNDLSKRSFSPIRTDEEKFWQTLFGQTIIIFLLVGLGTIIYLWYRDQQVIGFGITSPAISLFPNLISNSILSWLMRHLRLFLFIPFLAMAMGSPLQDHLMIDSRATATLEQVVLGLNSSISKVEDYVRGAIAHPSNLFLLALVCNHNKTGYGRAYSELAEFAHDFLTIYQDSNLHELGYGFSHLINKYKQQVNIVFGLFKQEFTKELIMSLQFELQKVLEDKKQRDKRKDTQKQREGGIFS